MRVRESFLRDFLRLVAWYPFRFVVERLPPRAALAVFRALGDLHWAVAADKRRRLERNLGRMGLAPGQAMRRAVRENFRNHYVSQLLVFVYPRLARESLADIADFSGLKHLDAALARGRGAVLIQAHLGPEQLALAALSLLGRRAMQIGCVNETGLSAVGRGVSLRLRRRYEGAIPGEMLDAREGLLPAFRVLRENGLVLCSGDGAGWLRRLGEHVLVRLCGQPVLFPTGAARMALGCGAAILPLFVVRGKTKPFTVTIEPPLEPSDVQDAGRSDGPDVETRIAREFARRYERRLLDDPGAMRFLDLFEPGELIETKSPAPPGGSYQTSPRTR
ncbi:lauroyl acyltransferase [Desulfovibrio sulfodismutans]|uniref:Lauroyl acyltransferase n=1 Tax=Desulfolutivibrio sulfodismutans TaxID=63561 RepID=A0A7K3NI38_9BACT|nr:lauroyl acyltransferase [Desulfolutivibrio sulfodismutans]NDY55455.1 lauroyl acyltransferase [Desulfolutivibrio sulfodismutans]